MKLIKCITLEIIYVPKEEIETNIQSIKLICAELLRINISKDMNIKKKDNKSDSLFNSYSSKLYDVLDSLSHMNWLKNALFIN